MQKFLTFFNDFLVQFDDAHAYRLFYRKFRCSGSCLRWGNSNFALFWSFFFHFFLLLLHYIYNILHIIIIIEVGQRKDNSFLQPFSWKKEKMIKYARMHDWWPKEIFNLILLLTNKTTKIWQVHTTVLLGSICSFFNCSSLRSLSWSDIF